MSEWWTYSLSDFLLFAPATYYRLFELYNQDLWPAQFGTVLAGAFLVALLAMRARWANRCAAVLLAAAWTWIGWAFFLERYATINWAADYMAWGFFLQALLLAWLGAARGAHIPPAPWTSSVGLALAAFAVAVEPAIGPLLLGRPWTEAALFGLAPDPTAVATLGAALAMRPAWSLLILPVAWCVVSGLTLFAMGAGDAFLLPAAAAITILSGLLAAWWKRRAPSAPAP